MEGFSGNQDNQGQNQDKSPDHGASDQTDNQNSGPEPNQGPNQGPAADNGMYGQGGFTGNGMYGQSGPAGSGMYGQDGPAGPYGFGGQGWQQGPDNRRTAVLPERPGRNNSFGGPGGPAGPGIPGKPRRGGLKIFLIILGLCLLLVIIAAVGCEEDEDYASGPYIGTLYVEGTIQSGNVDSFGMSTGYQHSWTLTQLDQMMYDSDNEGLILYVDSPGGGVYESDELYLKIKEYQEVSGNPVYAYMGSMAASGGYYISAPADKIYANRNTWTGSIGVTIGTVYDFSGFLERFGIRTQTITSGRNKSMGSSVEPMSEEQRAIWQALVDEAYAQFAEVVAEGRGLSVERVREIADGRIYSAKQAQELKLVDNIGSFEDAVSDMRRAYKLGDCEVVDIVYRNNSFWGSVLSGFAHIRPAGSSEAEAILSLIESDGGMPISYMCEWMR